MVLDFIRAQPALRSTPTLRDHWHDTYADAVARSGPSRPAENVQSRSSFAGVPLLGCLYKGVETLPQEPSDLS